MGFQTQAARRRGGSDYVSSNFPSPNPPPEHPAIPAQCPSTPHPTLWRRADRFVAVEGTSPVLIRNAKILTSARNGTEVVFGDVLPAKVVVLGVGYIPHALTHPPARPTSVYSALALEGWPSRVAQILPGSANNIGGKAFLIRLRPNAERSASAMLLEPPASTPPTTDPNSRRENPSDYSQMRMDSAWAVRAASDEARKIRDAQDVFCAPAETRLWDRKAALPKSLQGESQVDVLRGRVKLSVNCYEARSAESSISMNTPRSSHSPSHFRLSPLSVNSKTLQRGSNFPSPPGPSTTRGRIPAIALFASNARKSVARLRVRTPGGRFWQIMAMGCGLLRSGTTRTRAGVPDFDAGDGGWRWQARRSHSHHLVVALAFGDEDLPCNQKY
ncbi:hypothetical protein B0H13DRAFT_1890632 [Mycena leptocephala]|nr:hypothetical protein B0H13DRAFT_1890632 [Mycena leptocephala]